MKTPIHVTIAILAAFALFAPGLLSAQATHGFVFTWDDPTFRTDGEPFDPATELQSYRMRCEGAENVERIIERGATDDLDNNVRQYEWVSAVQRGGWYDCSMTAVDTDALESDWSEIARVRKLAQPNPPGLRGSR